MWKLANLSPLPKESPLTECDQLRPISLTNVIMRLFERIIFQEEIRHPSKLIIDKNHKAFDSVPHDILTQKLKSTNLNPYIINWLINFISCRKQRVTVDGTVTNFVNINRGVPQGTVLGPFLFSLMVNDIEAKHPQTNNLVKFADDLTVSVPVTSSGDSALDEVTNIESWASNNRMKLNFKKPGKCYYVLVHLPYLPPLINGIRRKKWLKLLGVTFQENPRCWDKQVDSLLSKAANRIYILRVCKFYGYSLNELTKLFDSLILSLFYYAIEVWGSALQAKYIDKFNNNLWKFADDTDHTSVSEVIPKDRVSSLPDKVDEVNKGSNDNKFQLNPGKCKELRIDFTTQPFTEEPLNINGKPLEIVKSAKVLGIYDSYQSFEMEQTCKQYRGKGF
ncbi:Hypothetical predicted protein [Paramuricea clavata]|uniref:Uncharacterized protein n=1 Tax=Paramuricea clavata TaxID=317549 RepID=A0A7D9D5H1_PARCT|nr:Hypothetical predicted protein [Paramuricea clavata]